MYNVYVKRFFVITEFVHMNEKIGTSVNYMKEKVKEFQLEVLHPRLTPHLVPGWGVTLHR